MLYTYIHVYTDRSISYDTTRKHKHNIQLDQIDVIIHNMIPQVSKYITTLYMVEFYDVA